MMLQINPITANGENRFEILENARLLHKVSAPFYKPATPVGRDDDERVERFIKDAYAARKK